MVKEDDEGADTTVYLPPPDTEDNLPPEAQPMYPTEETFQSYQDSTDDDSGDSDLNIEPTPVQNGLEVVEIDQDLFLSLAEANLEDID